MLVDTDLPASQVKRLAGNIYRASRRIQELLQELLNVSRGKSGALEVCRLREVARPRAIRWRAMAGAQSVQIEISIPAEIEAADGAQPHGTGLSQPDRATRWRPCRKAARCASRRSCEDGAAVVHVEDNGPGIPPEIRSQLFQPFVSAGKRNGLGLGLALSAADRCSNTAATCGWNRHQAEARASAFNYRRRPGRTRKVSRSSTITSYRSRARKQAGFLPFSKHFRLPGLARWRKARSLAVTAL